MSAPLFSTGTARGGTNLLAKMLSVSPEVYLACDPWIPLFRSWRDAIVREPQDSELISAVPPGAPLSDYYFSDIQLRVLEAVQGAHSEIPFDVRERQVLLSQIAVRANLSASNLVPLLPELGGRTYQAWIEAGLRLIEKAAGGTERTWAGFNENWAIEFFPLLARGFPKARFIVILRDPRAALASALRAKTAAQIPHVVSFARHWRKCVAFYLQFLTMPLFKDRLFFLTYEELARDPRILAKSLCEFLEIPFDPSMLDAERFRAAEGCRWQGNSHYETPGSGIYTGSIDRWKESLAPEVIETIEWVTGPELSLLGYRPYVYTGVGLPGQESLRFMVKDSRSCQGWRTDTGEPHRDLAFELLRREWLGERFTRFEEALMRSAFLFESAWERLKSNASIPSGLREEYVR